MNVNDFWPQDRSQNAPRRAQDGSKRVPKAIIFHVDFCLRFWTVLGSIWGRFGEPFEPQDRSKIQQKIIKKIPAATYPKKTTPRGLKSAPRGPKTPQEASRSPQEAPKTLPRGSQEAPKGTQHRPRLLQVTSGMPQDGLMKLLSERIPLILQLHSMTVLLASTMQI